MRAQPRFGVEDRVRSGAAFVVIVWCLAFAIGLDRSAAASEVPPNSCSGADALRLARLFDVAVAAYAELLKANPDLPCAVAGVKSVASDRAQLSIETAKRLAERGYTAAAIEELKRALGMDPAVTVPGELRVLWDDAATNDPFAAAVRLSAAGFRDEAVAALKKAVTEHPGASVPPALRDLNDPFAAAVRLSAAGFRDEAVAALKTALTEHPGASVPPALRDLQVRDVARLADELAIDGASALRVAGVLLFGGYILFFLVYALSWFWRGWQLRIADFSASDASLARPLAFAIGQAIRKLQEDGGGNRLYVADYTAQDFKIADLAEPVPQLKGVAALVGLAARLAPQKSWILNGVVHPPGARGAGLTLTLSRQVVRTTITDSVTLWEDDYGLVKNDDKSYSPYYRLATIAAVWTGYGVARDGVATGAGGIAGFATQSWRSYAYFASGAEWFLKNDMGQSRAQLLQALDNDPENWLARFNLAHVDLRGAILKDLASYSADHDRARARLRSVRAALDARPAGGTP